MGGSHPALIPDGTIITSSAPMNMRGSRGLLSPAGKAEMTMPAYAHDTIAPPSGGSTLPGRVRCAPLRVADGDGMDRPHSGAAAAGETTPGNTLRAEVKEGGKWQRKSLGKDGKTIMMIFLE